MESPSSLKVGCKIQVTTKDDVKIGTCAFVGLTSFAPGKWVGVVLEDDTGKNNGEVQGKKYFTCADNRGIFVRPNQVQVMDGDVGSSSGTSSPMSQSMESLATPRPKSGLKKPSGLMTPGSSLKQPGAGLKTPSATGLASRGSSSSLTGSKTDLSSSGSKGSSTNLSGSATPAATMKTPASGLSKPRQSLAHPKKVSSSASMDKVSENVTPTSSTVQAPPSFTTATPPEPVSRSDDLEEINKLKADIKDLSEKLDTIKLKRQEDKAKLKEADKLKIMYEQLKEYKARSQEGHKDLQHQLQAAKRDTKEIQEAFDNYKDEMMELQETIEMSALDKEMAEEKAEGLAVELTAIQEKNDEFQATIKLLRSELEGGAGGQADGVSSYQVKQLEQQNEKLKEALVRMRDISNNDKSENSSLKKQLEKFQHEVTHLHKDKELRHEEIEILNAEIIDLKDQVDAALGAEDMVEKLTDTNLTLEEAVATLEEEKADLEAINEMNEELQENAREVELDMREQLDLARADIARTEQSNIATQLQVADLQTTIAKYRELVQQLHDQNASLARSHGDVVAAPTVESIDMKSVIIESKAQAKVIEMELLRLELSSLTQRLTLTERFLPDSFFLHGADNEGIQLCQLLPATLERSTFLSVQLRGKYPLMSVISNEDVTKSQRAELASYGAYLQSHLSHLRLNLHKLRQAIDKADTATYKALVDRLAEIRVYTKPVTQYLELLQRDELSESHSTDSLKKAIDFFQDIVSSQFSDFEFDSSLMKDESKLLVAVSDSLLVDLKRLSVMIADESSESRLIGQLLKMATDLSQAAKRMKHCLPKDGSTTQVSVPSEIAARVSKSIKSLVMLMEGIYTAAVQADRDLSLQPEASNLSSTQIKQYLVLACETLNSDEPDPKKALQSSLQACVDQLSSFVTQLENGQFDSTKVKVDKVVAILERRAAEFKKETGEGNTKSKLSAKEEMVAELKSELRKKHEEVEEYKLRSGMADRKVTSAVKEKDDQILKLQRLIEEAQTQLKKKEREFEKTMDTLQNDIDSLEAEKSGLQTKLNNMTKKQLYDSLSKSMGSSSSPGGGGVGIDSPMLLEQIKSLKSTVNMLRQQLAKKQANSMMTKLAAMKPLVPAKNTLAPTSRDQPGNQVEQRRSELCLELSRLHKDTCSYAETRKVSSVRTAPESLLGSEQYKSADRLQSISHRLQELHERTQAFIGSAQPYGVRSDMQSFVNTKTMEMLKLKPIGRITVPAPGKSEIVKVNMNYPQLRTLLQQIP